MEEKVRELLKAAEAAEAEATEAWKAASANADAARAEEKHCHAQMIRLHRMTESIRAYLDKSPVEVPF